MASETRDALRDLIAQVQSRLDAFTAFHSEKQAEATMQLAVLSERVGQAGKSIDEVRQTVSGAPHDPGSGLIGKLGRLSGEVAAVKSDVGDVDAKVEHVREDVCRIHAARWQFWTAVISAVVSALGVIVVGAMTLWKGAP